MSSDGRVSVRHLGSGKYGDVFCVKDHTCAAAMKVSYYRDSTLRQVAACVYRGDLQGALRAKKEDAISVSSKFARFTTRLLHSVSPHFVYVYADFDCDGLAERLRNFLVTRLAELTPAQRRHTNVCFMERFDTSLTQYLVSCPVLADAVLRSLVFQVLYTLQCLHRLLPGFRHNDLSTNNVLARHVSNGVTAAYSVGPRQYRVYRVPVLIAITDYDFVHVPNHPSLSNERILSGKYSHMDPSSNPSYDAHLFLSSVARCLRRRTDTTAFESFFKFVTPLLVPGTDRLTSFQARCTPSALLQDPYFAPLERQHHHGTVPRYICP
jgi:serine/threonine protein kinase